MIVNENAADREYYKWTGTFPVLGFAAEAGASQTGEGRLRSTGKWLLR